MFEGALQTLLTVLGITAAVAFVIAYLFANVRRQRNNVLRETNTDLIQRLELLEQERDRLLLRVDGQQKQIDMLRDMATGSTAITDLRQEILTFFKQHDEEAKTRYRLLLEAQDKIAEAIGKFTQAVTDVQRNR